MGELLWENPHGMQIMRCKGSITCANENSMATEYLLQGVDDLFEFRELKPSCISDGVYKHRMLFIGRNIDKDYLNE